MKNITFLISMLFATNVIAAEQIGNRGVKRIQVYDTYAVIAIDTPHLNLEECTKNGAVNYVAITLESAGGKEKFSTVLSARVSGKEVGYGVSGCLTWGDGTIPLVYRVDF